MSVALFVPCYIDQFYPDVAIASLELLERLGVEVEYPSGQTCCGQPMANTGCTAETAPVARHFVETFADYDAIVCPSGSCTAMVRHHYAGYFRVSTLGSSMYAPARSSCANTFMTSSVSSRLTRGFPIGFPCIKAATGCVS